MRRYKRAKHLHDVATKTYSNSVSMVPGKTIACKVYYNVHIVPVGEEMVEQWIYEEKQLILSDGQRGSMLRCYAASLNLHFIICF